MDTSTLPRRGDSITVTVQHYSRRCTRRGCPGTAGARVPTDGRCIYLSRRGEQPCDQPYTKADWKRGDLTHTGRVTGSFTATHSGTLFIRLRQDGVKGELAIPWLPDHVTTWSPA